MDAVYIPLPTGLRKEWVLRAAAAGKHVICEKPCGVSFADVQEMMAACRKNRVQFMDGVMFMHSPRLARVREILDDGKSVGPMRRISSAFSFYGSDEFFRDNIRVDGRLEPAGCLGDLGWYCIRFALWTMNWQLPHTVTGRILSQSDRRSAAGCPRRRNFPANCFLTAAFPRDFTVRFSPPHQQWVLSAARKAGCGLPDFVHPFNSYEPAFEVNQTEIRVREAGGGQRHAHSGVRPSWAIRRRRTPACSATSPTRFSPANSTTTGRCGR